MAIRRGALAAVVGRARPIDNTSAKPVDNDLARGLSRSSDALFMTTEQGLYSLNPDDGSTLAFMPLPSSDVFGIAAVGDHVYISDDFLDLIYKIDPRTQTIVTTFGLFAIHENTPQGPFELRRGMSESLDGSVLLVETNKGALSIDVQTGLASPTLTPLFQWDASAVDGELYLTVGDSIGVFNSEGMIVRTLPFNVSFSGPSSGPFIGIGAANVAGPAWTVNLGRTQDVTGRDFTTAADAAPTNIGLSSTSIHENVDAWFAELSVDDESIIDSHVYSLVSGVDDNDNDRFRVVDGRLELVEGGTIDFETQSDFRVRLMVMDSSGQSVQTAMVIDVLDLVEVENVIINDGHVQRSSLESLAIRFEGAVQIGAEAFNITNRGTRTPVDFAIAATEFANGYTRVTLKFTGDQMEFGSLVDGWYRLEIQASGVVSESGLGLDSDRDGSPGDNFVFGESATDKFYRRYGDGNGDGIVNGRDFRLFVSTYGQLQTSPLYLSFFDVTGDGIVNGRDFRQFRTRYGVPFLF